MWQQTFSKEYADVKKELIWQIWTEVHDWPKWDHDLDYCELKGDFIAGNKFILKPQGGPKVTLWLTDIVPNNKFTDYCKFFGATMHDAHTLEDTPRGVKVTNTITVTGPLAWLWARLVAKNVAASVPQQTNKLIEYARARDE